MENSKIHVFTVIYLFFFFLVRKKNKNYFSKNWFCLNIFELHYFFFVSRRFRKLLEISDIINFK